MIFSSLDVATHTYIGGILSIHSVMHITGIGLSFWLILSVSQDLWCRDVVLGFSDDGFISRLECVI